MGARNEKLTPSKELVRTWWELDKLFMIWNPSADWPPGVPALSESGSHPGRTVALGSSQLL